MPARSAGRDFFIAKRYDHLYPKITDFANLWLAWRRTSRGKRGKPAAAGFKMLLEDQLITLQRELVTETWHPGAYRSFHILDPKPRLVSAAPFRDRVVHHALCLVIEPLFERTFIGDSYANRKGKGTHAALSKAQRFIRGHRYVLQCDIRQFFPSIDHAILYDLLDRKIVDKQALWLIQQIIQSGAGVLANEYDIVYYPGDDLFAAARPRGLPIGNLTSQFWANVYLKELDQFVKRQLRCKAYLRYVDDCVLFADSKETLWAWKQAVQGFLQQLRLSLHERSSTVFPVTQGLPFLGFRLYADHRRLKCKNGVNFSRRLRRDYRAYARGELTREALNRRVHGWIAHAEHADTWGLRKSLFSTPLPVKEAR